MKRPALLAVVAAGLMLAGCYMSETPLLNPAEAVHPVAVGRQAFTAAGAPEPIEVTVEADGWYSISGDGKTTRLLFTPLTTIGSRTLLAYGADMEGGFIYGVAERRGGDILLDLPTCEPGPARDIAVAHDGKPPDPGVIGAVCEFASTDALKGALIDYARRTDLQREYAVLPAAPD